MKHLLVLLSDGRFFFERDWSVVNALTYSYFDSVQSAPVQPGGARYVFSPKWRDATIWEFSEIIKWPL